MFNHRFNTVYAVSAKTSVVGPVIDLKNTLQEVHAIFNSLDGSMNLILSTTIPFSVSSLDGSRRLLSFQWRLVKI